MTANITLKATWNHDPLPAGEQTSLAYLLLDITQQDAPVPPPASSGGAQPLNLSLVLDRSGSMGGAKLQNLKKAVAWVVDHLSPQDTIAITLFDDDVHPLVPSTKADDPRALLGQVEAIKEAGGTAMSKGLAVGLSEAMKAQGQGVVSRIVVLTDGQTWGDGQQCIELAAQAGAAGIPVTALGVGAEEDWSIELLDAIASESGGNVDYIANPDEIAGTFEKTLRAMQATTARNSAPYLHAYRRGSGSHSVQGCAGYIQALAQRRARGARPDGSRRAAPDERRGHFPHPASGRHPVG